MEHFNYSSFSSSASASSLSREESTPRKSVQPNNSVEKAIVVNIRMDDSATELASANDDLAYIDQTFVVDGDDDVDCDDNDDENEKVMENVGKEDEMDEGGPSSFPNNERLKKAKKMSIDELFTELYRQQSETSSMLGELTIRFGILSRQNVDLKNRNENLESKLETIVSVATCKQ